MGESMDPSQGSGRHKSRAQRARESARDLGTYTAIPAMILVGLVGGYFLGVWLEGRYGYEPWLGLGGLVLGGVASVRKVVQVLRTAQRRNANRARPSNSSR